jgi:hypothetical protein
MVNRTSYFFRPGWPGSYDMSHREAESMLNYSSKFVFTYILGTIASCRVPKVAEASQLNLYSRQLLKK